MAPIITTYYAARMVYQQFTETVCSFGICRTTKTRSAKVATVPHKNRYKGIAQLNESKRPSLLNLPPHTSSRMNISIRSSLQAEK